MFVKFIKTGTGPQDVPRFKMTGTGGGIRTKFSISAADPASMPGLVAWYKADSLALSNGATVTSWPDLSPNGNTLNIAQGTPTYNASDAFLGGKPSITYNGSSANYRSNPTGLPVGSAAHTTYAVGYWNGNTSTPHFMFAWGANTIDGDRLGIAWSTIIGMGSGMVFESRNIGSAPRGVGANSPFIFSFPYIAGSSYASAATFLNGVGLGGAFGSGGPNIANPVPEISIGRPPNASFYRWTGAVSEIIVYNTTHDSATRTSIEMYLAAKYGITI